MEKSVKKLTRNDGVMVSIMPDGEKMMLDIEQGKYFALNKIAAVIWDELEEPKSVEELIENLTARFSAAEATIRNDVLMFLEDMQVKKLIILK